MAVITIDGIRLNVENNRNVLDCALEAGVYIPHLCHHPALSELGSCRMCIVEVEGRDGVETSCTMKAKDGMVIHTKSERLTKLRTLAMELLLSAHPEDCSTCPVYGDCELQTLMQYIGASGGRVKMRSKGFKSDDRNPLFIHDMNRCILCGRCVRACDELRGVKVLRYNKKDMETYVGTIHDKLLADADCRFCGACAQVCPTGTIRDKVSFIGSGKTREDVMIPCKAACPAGTDVPRYVRLTKEGKYSEATAVVREKAPMPKVLGYICNHVCELDCKRGQVNSPISIRNIKRFAAEHDVEKIWEGKGISAPSTGKRVCVVGGGPAGLIAAHYLRKKGHEVVLKEALEKTGGMLQYGIPSYRLPREIVDEEVDILMKAGVTVETGVRIENPERLLGEGFDAVLMATGTHSGVRLPIEGNCLEGVLLNIDFLRNVSMGIDPGMGEKVVVLGGGNVAFDCARSAKRLGAREVHLACLEAENAMPADKEEIEQALEEGIFVHPGRTFEKITGEEHCSGMLLMEVESFSFDANRNAVIRKVDGSEQLIEADTVIFAVGQRSAITEESGLKLGRGNSILVGENSLKTDKEGIFAAGDVVYGTASVIRAIASGRKAAAEIDVYLGGDGDINEILAPVEKPNPHIGVIEKFGYLERIQPDLALPGERAENFGLMDFGICEKKIGCETERCLQCDLRLQIQGPKLWGDYSSQTIKEAE
ncbi:FAD-dependent oxidoreductase [Parasporobacterium paucivorans]|uniref:NADPH-dependent glutamate synthase beta chain n=1 Tax=Parasporobacterium paucivorans DSM 15970 TaxID=1122934 RepID=A0A1M6BX73_9FIRM|nr:FAD-dependent oxidoreductase [Parasporobacterium paucivorans]SHI53362.1 NADPH-dependent glutamate synthase beta chain [Parasporobacterium paucivorans DSM 15970]